MTDIPQTQVSEGIVPMTASIPRHYGIDKGEIGRRIGMSAGNMDVFVDMEVGMNSPERI